MPRLARRLGVVLVLAVLAACDARGCLPSERVVVVYRGATPIDVAAEVKRGDETVGVVTEVHAGDGAQRVVVALSKAALLNTRDRFIPSRGEQGVGFKVITGKGEPLHDGEVVEAGFAPRPAAPVAAAPPPPAALSARELERPETGPDGSVAERSGLPPWTSVPPQEDITRAGLNLREFNRVDPALRRRPEEIVSKARSLSPDEAVAFLSRERGALVSEFDAALREAQSRGDRAGAAQLRELRIKTLGMVTRMRAQAARSR